MALFKSILDSLKLVDDDGDDELEDDYDEYVEKQQEKERKRQEQKAQRQEQPRFSPRRSRPAEEDTYSGSDYGASTQALEPRKEKPARTNVNKVVPLRRNVNGFEVCIMKPANFEDSQEICDMLLNGRAAVINLEGYDVELAQRIMDFISGAVYAVSGKLHQISNYIFIISPDNIDISGDYLDMIQQNGFDVPTFTKNF